MPDMTPRDRARASDSLFRKRMAEVNAGDVAQLIGWSDSKVSELKNKHMEDCLTLLAHVGLKVVDSNSRCMSQDAFNFLTESHRLVVQKAPTLIWGDE